MKKWVSMVSALVTLSAFVVGCEEDDPANGGAAAPAPVEKVSLTSTCGSPGDHVIASYTGDTAFQCGDFVLVNGQRVMSGLESYNADDHRWSYSFNLPEGLPSMDVSVIAVCNGEPKMIGYVKVPCPPSTEPVNAFERFAGDLVMTGGCDDEDHKVSLESFTPDSFVMTGLSDNLPITFTVTGNVATAENVNQYGPVAHTVKLHIELDGTIRFDASSGSGACTGRLSKG